MSDNAAGRTRRSGRMPLDNPAGTERLSRTGDGCIGIDAQHGLLDDRGWLIAVDAGGRGAGIDRVPASAPTWSGQTLRAAAAGVAAGIHCQDVATAARQFTVATVSSGLVQAATTHPKAAQG